MTSQLASGLWFSAMPDYGQTCVLIMSKMIPQLGKRLTGAVVSGKAAVRLWHTLPMVQPVDANIQNLLTPPDKGKGFAGRIRTWVQYERRPRAYTAPYSHGGRRQSLPIAAGWAYQRTVHNFLNSRANRKRPAAEVARSTYLIHRCWHNFKNEVCGCLWLAPSANAFGKERLP